MRPPPRRLRRSPSLSGTLQGFTRLGPHRTACCWLGRAAEGPRPLLRCGIRNRARAPEVTTDSHPPRPSPLPYQLKHFRVQAKKPKSILKKSLKGQNTNTREAVWWWWGGGVGYETREG